MNKPCITVMKSESRKGSFVNFGVLFSFWLSITACPSPLLAQTDQKKEVPERLPPRITLSSTQISGDSIILKTEVKTKRNGVIQALDFEKIKFFDRNDSLLKPLGEALTDDKGAASLTIGTGHLVTGDNGLWTFGTSFEGDEEFSGGEEEISVLKAGIDFSGEIRDTIYSIKIKLFSPTHNNQPITDAEVGFYVKRFFSNLKIGEGTTDANGEVVIECPHDLHGDEQGNIILIGKVEDLEEYGSVAGFIIKPWGIPQSKSDEKMTRALWSHSPPLWMVITFSFLMSLVWGHYMVIIYKLFRLRKM